jgi:DNA repair protein RecO (recombination protein O)
MIEPRIELQPAFVLQQRKFRETSLILDVFTRDYGIVCILAKGVRTAKSKTAALLQPFTALIISYSNKAELKLLTHVERAQDTFNLAGMPLYCGFYLNELISLLVHKEDPYPELFVDYINCLHCLTQLTESSLIDPKQLQDPNNIFNLSLEAALRIFELNLLEKVGFALPIQRDAKNQMPIKASARYLFVVEQGVVEHPEGKISGKTLHALQKQQFDDEQTLTEAKYLMRSVINFHLNGKSLKTRTFISKMQTQR